MTSCTTPTLARWLADDVDKVDAETFFKYYATCLELVIRCSNLETMACMWDSYYHCDRNCPDYEGDVELALKYANLPTVALALHGLNNYRTLDLNSTISMMTARKWAMENKAHGEEISKLLDQFILVTNQCKFVNNFLDTDDALSRATSKFFRRIIRKAGYDLEKVETELNLHRVKVGQ